MKNLFSLLRVPVVFAGASMGGVLCLFGAFAWGSATLLERPVPLNPVLADKVSMALRDVPASLQEREDLSQGKTTAAELSASYLSDPLFKNKLARFWLSELKIQSRVSAEDTEIKRDSSPAKSINKWINDNRANADLGRIIYFNKPSGPGCVARFEKVSGAVNPPDAATYAKEKASCENSPAGQAKETACSTVKTFDGRIAARKRFDDVYKCKCGEEIKVKPYWNPTSEVLACPSVVSAPPVSKPKDPKVTVCGNNLENCYPFDPLQTPRVNSFPAYLDMHPQPYPGGSFLSNVMASATFEPGLLIAQIVSERDDFRKVLTDTRTVLDGPLETFYQSVLGKALLSQLPANTFKVGDVSQLDPKAATRKTHRWVERGPAHAGVLTTWAFQQFTNGYRAKANRVYEAFMCKRFLIPPGVVESNTESNDLLVRQPCASCHEHLEPMGTFFNRWHREGVNYIYTASANADGKILSNGTWQSGSDAADLGKLVSHDSRFSECAVQRAFEFVMGRSFNAFEKETLQPQILAQFQDSHDFFGAIEAVIESPSFSGSLK